MKRFLTRLASRMGYTVLPNWSLHDYPLTTCLRELFASRGISTVIDVGANKGQYREYLRHHVGFKGPIISFEPVPELVAELRGRAKDDPNWTIRGCGLGAAPGELTLNVTASTVFSSFRQPRASDEFDAGNTVTRVETVPVSTLDAEFPDLGMLRRAYLKLDTQGFDLEVMRGAPLAASVIPALQSEVSFSPIYEEMPSYAETLDEFGRLGFAVSDMFLVNKNEAGVAIDFDCVMVRRPSGG